MLSTIGRAAIRRTGLGASYPHSGRVGELAWRLRQICIIENACNSTQAYSPDGTRAGSRGRRSFATASKTPTTARATKTKTKPKSTTIKKPTTRASKRVTAKPKAKPKRKVAKLPKKPVKKVLTEEQKAKRAEVKVKEEVKALKAAALLSEPKQLPATAWAVLVSEYVKEQKSEMGQNFSGVTKAVTGAAAKYKSLSPSDREHYNHISNRNKQANDAAYKQWVEKHTPEQIRIANTARLRLKRKESKAGSQKYSPISDPRIPKKPLNARAAFTKERWATGDMKGISLIDAAKSINEEWNALSAAEKKQFEDTAAADQTRYAREYKTVFHHEMPSHRKPALAATT